jgi:Ca2+/Na+ antiporter
MCFAWLIGMSFIMTVSVQAIAGKLGISDAVAGLTIGAAGTSFPNLFASMIVARQVEANE